MKQGRFANVVAYVFEFEMFQPFFPRFFQTTILSNNNSRDERAENESRQKHALPSLHKSCRRRSELMAEKAWFRTKTKHARYALQHRFSFDL
jgi:hypothetical protein